MIFHKNRLLTDNSYKISYLIFFRKLRKTSQDLSSAAVVIGALRVKSLYDIYHIFMDRHVYSYNKDLMFTPFVV